MKVIESPTCVEDSVTKIIGFALYYYNVGCSGPHMWREHYNKGYKSLSLSYYNECYNVSHLLEDTIIKIISPTLSYYKEGYRVPYMPHVGRTL